MEESRTPTPELQRIERVLGKTLVPISPRIDFASHLQGRLERIDDKETLILSRGTDRRRVTLIGLASLLTAIAFVLAGYRAVAALLSGLGLLQQLGEQVKSRKNPPLSPTG